MSSNVARLGVPTELKAGFKEGGPDFLMRSYLETLQSAVGEKGSILMPTFTYSATKGEVFDVRSTPSTVGNFTDWFWKNAEQRSLHPIFSYAGSGPAVKQLLSIETWDSFGPQSFFEKMRKLNGKYLMFGCEIWEGATCVYHAEQMAPVSYRYLKNFAGKIKDENAAYIEAEIPYFVRDLKLGYRDHWRPLFEDSLAAGIARSLPYRSAPLTALEAQSFHEFILEKVKLDRHYLIAFDQ